MVHLYQILLGILFLQCYVYATPSDVNKLKDMSKVEEANIKVETDSTQVEDEHNSTETSRQKRYYNPYGPEFPPLFNPFIYSNPNIGDFGVEDPLIQIHRRVQDIANIVRQPPPPPIPQVPVFYPIFYVPPFDCNCEQTNLQPTEPPTTNNSTSPNVTTRFPAMDDERQNWGTVVNDSARDNGDDEQDFSRPISFEPIRLNRPTARPSPPVERGTLQGDAANNQKPQAEETSPPPSPTRRPPPPPTSTPIPPFNSQPPPRAPYPPKGFSTVAPTACDSAILTCCHRRVVTYDCFAVQGCPNFTSFGNPCDNNSILRIINLFQQYYGNIS